MNRYFDINKDMLTCYHCKNLFTPQRINKKKPKKYCSLVCCKEAKKSKKELHPCAVCDVLTINPKFCCKSCSATYTNTHTPRRSKSSPLWHPCLTCGTSTKNVNYCSNKCKPKLTIEERYIKHRAVHNEAWQRYMAKRKNQTPSNIDIKELQQFYLNCPEGYEVDHIIPISKGGLHCLENLQYLTISENRRKSNKII